MKGGVVINTCCSFVLKLCIWLKCINWFRYRLWGKEACLRSLVCIIEMKTNLELRGVCELEVYIWESWHLFTLIYYLFGKRNRAPSAGSPVSHPTMAGTGLGLESGVGNSAGLPWGHCCHLPVLTTAEGRVRSQSLISHSGIKLPALGLVFRWIVSSSHNWNLININFVGLMLFSGLYLFIY